RPRIVRNASEAGTLRRVNLRLEGPRRVGTRRPESAGTGSTGETWMIVTEGLTKHYGPVQALTDLTLEVRRGEVFGLLGPNGSGKTTTIRLLLGLLRPSAGAASVRGLDCWRHSVAVRRLVSYLPGEVRLP